MKRFLFALASAALLLGMSRFAALAIDADPNQSYDVTPAAGAWMICAASYSGDEAGDIAHRMVLEIRRNFGLPAYVFNRGRDERAKQRAEIERIHHFCPEGRIRGVRIEEQFAVLVGGYKDMESARSALDGFKKLKPSDPKALDIMQWDDQKPGANGKTQITGHTIAYVNPFMRSFVVRNPTVLNEPVKEDKHEEKFLHEINADESYSVYKCRKPWTLAVAVFQAPTLVQSANSSSFLDKLMGASNGEHISGAAMTAHNMAKLLEELSHDPRLKEPLKEVYVFHTRNNSVVTIGGFDRQDDPRMGYVQAVLRDNLLRNNPQLQLLKQPLPMEVPH
jgi:hypothetical protein